MKKCLLTLAGMLILTSSFAQQFSCGLTEKLNKLYAEDPQMEKDFIKLMKNSMSIAKDGDDSTVFTIPVVFHIIHKYGTENITDAQIFNQMDILNRDYRLLNADTSDVVQEFKQLYSDIKIEFKLAAYDPNGNCTNGIEHIYSHEAYQGDDASKLNQWPRYRYLNVWVVDQMENGVAGYAYYPNATDGAGFYRDGIIILNNYIGSIGTGNLNGSRALTHEIGHWLGLPHCWGSTNDPGLACGDDGIDDTPITKGYNLFCPNTAAQAKICDTAIVENFQNYMEYSYCSVMFTKDQKDVMRTNLQQISGQRNQLIDSANAVFTGINLVTPPVCKPIADFNAANQYNCLGTAITFNDRSYNSDVDTWAWTFTDGSSTITSTSQNPSVTFANTGYHDVTLIVGNQYGYDTIVKNDYIYTWNNAWSHVGPGSYDLNTVAGNSDQFGVFNYEENHSYFKIIQQNGVDNSKCFKLNTYFDNSPYYPYSNEGMYYDRLAGSVDEIITPSFDLTHTTGVTITFDYAYASNGLAESDITEKIIVYASKNCGQTWTPRKTITGAALTTMGYAGYSDTKPTNNTMWKTATANYNATGTDYNTIFKIEFTASDVAGNLYIDNININGTLGINELDTQLDINVYPNPVNDQDELTVAYTAGNEEVTFELRDTQGKAVYNEVRNELNQEVSFNLNTKNLSAGCYYLVIRSNGYTTTKKVMVL